MPAERERYPWNVLCTRTLCENGCFRHPGLAANCNLVEPGGRTA
ncbi:hypothetical protein Nmel_008618, partial [Mimus melanotis]